LSGRCSRLWAAAVSRGRLCVNRKIISAASLGLQQREQSKSEVNTTKVRRAQAARGTRGTHPHCRTARTCPSGPYGQRPKH
jgi:hypothetical protein